MEYSELKKRYFGNNDTNKKLTDEEIIKRLEKCVKRGNRNYDTDIVLDLINRQKSEIERLKSANDEKFRQWDMLAEKTKQHYADLYNEAKDILKAEAYKEFAEKLKNICEEIMAQEWNEKTAPISWSYAYEDFIDDIDNLLKVMVGEEE